MPADSLDLNALTLLDQVVISTPLTVAPETLLEAAIARMHEAKTSYVLITQQQRPIGIFTERDLVRLVASGQPIAGVTMATVMTPEVRTLTAVEVKDALSIFQQMRKQGVRHWPVVDETGRLMGIITKRSLRQSLTTPALLKFRPVAEVMAADVVCAPQAASVLQVARLMAAHNVSCVVMTDAKEHPVGILTERDIVQFQTLGIDISQAPAQQVMSMPLLPIHPQDSLWAAHQQMTQHRVRRLVVCTRRGSLAGVVTQSSILQALDPAEVQEVVSLLQQEVEQLRSDNQALITACNRELEREQRRLSQQLEAEQTEHQLVSSLSSELKRDQIRLSEQLETKQAKQQQAEAQLRFQAGLLDAISQAVIATDLTGQILYWNRYAETLYGWSAEEVMGRDIVEIIPTNTTRAQAAEIMESLRRGEQWAGEFLVRHKDGTTFPAWVIDSPIYDDQGNLVGIVGVSTDISDRKRTEAERERAAEELQEAYVLLEQNHTDLATTNEELNVTLDELLVAESALQQTNVELEDRVESRTADLQKSEQRWRTLLETVHLAVVGLDGDGKITYANPFLLSLTGYTAAEVLGTDWFARFVLPSQQPLLRQYFQQLLSQPDAPLRYQHPILTRSGEERIITWNNTLLHDGGDTVIGTMSIGEDITERFALDRMKNEFISIVSHELRTPLTSIHGGLKLINKGLVSAQSERGQHLIQVAAENSQRLVRLVNDILEIERLESGKSPVQKQPLQTRDLTRQMAESFELLVNQAGINLEVSDPDFEIVADCDRINQVLTNLLDNAIKFSPAESTISLTVEPSEQADALDQNASSQAAVVFTVRDQGRGIPPEKCAKIFERFMQVDSSDSRQKGGTGLGLAICRSIVEQHGGQIWVESTPGEGSCFYFTLPVG
ncbi:MAG: PAS domain S-box protein [Cyanobacteria bacterium P01_D01_bin.44]